MQIWYISKIWCKHFDESKSFKDPFICLQNMLFLFKKKIMKLSVTREVELWLDCQWQHYSRSWSIFGDWLSNGVYSKLSERGGWVMDLITDFTETAGGASAVYWSHRQCCWSVRKTSAVGRCYHMLQKTWQNGKGEGFRLKIWKFKLASLKTCCP